jgi:hypothetical protein
MQQSRRRVSTTHQRRVVEPGQNVFVMDASAVALPM